MNFFFISKFVHSSDVNQTTFSSDLWNAIYFESYFSSSRRYEATIQAVSSSIRLFCCNEKNYYLSNHENMKRRSCEGEGEISSNDKK